MSDDISAQALFYGVALILPLSALIVRRPGWRQSGAMAFGWIAIFGVVLLGFAERDRIGGVVHDLRQAVDPEAGERRGEELRVPMAQDGHFWIRAMVNGQAVRFLIDSGATTTALGTDAARAAEVAPAKGFGGSFGAPVSTANGDVIAQRAVISLLQLGGIERRDVSVLVAPEFGDTNVLGMNFLSSLKRWGVEGKTLILVP